MTQEQFEEAKALIEQRDHYAEMARHIKSSFNYKIALDTKAKESEKPDKWLLSKFFTIRMSKAKNLVRVLPHWELAQSIDIEADPELVMIIYNWLESRVAEYNKKIEQI